MGFWPKVQMHYAYTVKNLIMLLSQNNNMSAVRGASEIAKLHVHMLQARPKVIELAVEAASVSLEMQESAS